MNTNYTNAGTQYNPNDFNMSLDEFVKLTEQIDVKFTRIFLANPLDLIEIDMKELSKDMLFISDVNVDKGTIMLVKDETLRNAFYQFAKQFPDRVFRGEKE